MNNKISEDDPIFYKLVLKGLLDQAKENGVNVFLKDNFIIFNDEKYGIITTECSVEIMKVKYTKEG